MGHSVLVVIDTARRITGHPSCVRRPGTGDSEFLVAALDKARKELGWKPKFATLEVIIESA